MRPFLNHPFRLGCRLLWLSVELIRAALDYVLWVLIRRAEPFAVARGQWLQRNCRRLLRIFNIEVQSQGPIPACGLLVSNHLSYVDILVLGAITPAVFVAKREVKSWPIFGWFAILAGTLFVDRRRRQQAGETVGEIGATLQSGQLVVLFPEGTSSDGRRVLPFKSSLLEPASRCGCPLFVARIAYELEHGDVGEEVCYWKDMTFLPHMLNLLTKRTIVARIRFSKVCQTAKSRKELARHLHSEVSRLGGFGSEFAAAA